jgi:uncharacterized membrane protein
MWFIVALIVGAGVAALAMWMRSSGIATKWYDWLVGAVGLLLLLLMVQNFFGSQAELETTAANLYLLILGLPALLLLAVAWQLVWRRNRAS